MDATELFSKVKPELNALNDEILSQLESKVPLVKKIAKYIIASGGKRLRPIIVILIAQACGYKGRDHIKLGAVIEFLHTATLLHDDVVDTSDRRRGKPTANAQWGNASSVLVGDYVYSRAFEMLVQIGQLNIMGTLAGATSVIAEGEVQQLLNINNPNITEEEYMQVIQGKTATLFAASGLTAAYLSQMDEDTCNAMQAYGMHLGMAFQIVDDVLDFTGDAEAMGKNVGDDLAEGKPTLPLIQTIKTGTEEQKALIKNAITKGGLENLEAILHAIEETDALHYCMQQANLQADLAIKQLDCLADSAHKDSLIALAKISVSRNV